MGRWKVGAVELAGWLLLATASGCGLGRSQPRARNPQASFTTTAANRPPNATSPSRWAAYCDGLGKRRAAFHLALSFEVRAAALAAREGYEPLTLTPDEQQVLGVAQSQLFVARNSVMSATDLDRAQIAPEWNQGGKYQVKMSVKAPQQVAPRLAPLVKGMIAVVVDGRLLSVPHLQSATIMQWPVATRLTLAEAQARAAELSPALDVVALQSLEEGCLASDEALCVPLAEALLIGRDAAYDPERAVALFEAGCRLGRGVACKRAAELATKQDHHEKLIESACKLHQADACVEAAQNLIEGGPEPQAVAQGEALLTRTCDEGSGKACRELADRRSKELGDSPSPAQTKSWLSLIERACSAGDSDSCFVAGGLARNGDIAPADAVAAQRWFRAGCALDPSGGALSFRIWSAELREFGCTDDWVPPPAPPSLCGSAVAKMKP